MEGCARLSVVDNDELKAVVDAIDANLRTITRKIAEGLDVDHATVARHLKKLGKAKSP